MIFAVFHKPFPVPESPCLKPIYVGPNKENICGSDVLKDNTGDNISQLNDHYCELTALYWIWKNYKQDKNDITGFCHYRRYFIEETFKPFISGLFFNNYIKRKESINFDNLMSERFMQKVEGLLERYAFIVPYYHHLNRLSPGLNIASHYRKYHSKEDWDLLKKLTCDLYPGYKHSFGKVEKLRKMFIYNMFISKRKDFDLYCEWLFPIMFSIYDKLEISNNSYQKRVMGFLSERLFNVYLIHNYGSERIKKLPVLSIID
jgi:hypothetical protein